ncbi:hypothetical protein [uncultured virus]|jgi:hypothetical protein|uniref:Uncharacterized protein n=1 Tax=uncultured virus TaxID=340016 RepID=A0A218ML80_9VIRU|nr:hypothetical protein [uncultured virus]
MKKPFNIHDWQAKQTIKRLTEQKDIDNIMRMNPDANRDSLDSLYQPDLSVYGKKDEDININKVLSNGGYDIIDDEELLKTVKARLKGKSNLDDLIDAEKLNLFVMKIEDEEGGNIDFNEASMTGTGASFTAGSGAGYMTPNAFKKKKKN